MTLAFSSSVGRIQGVSFRRLGVEVSMSMDANQYAAPKEHPNRKNNHNNEIARKRRLLQEARNRARFLQGKDLQTLRDNMKVMREKLKVIKATLSSTAAGYNDLSMALKDSIDKSERRDGDLEYLKRLAAVQHAKREFRLDEVPALEEEAQQVRQCLPRLNLQGLWISGSAEMVNVTYVGDLLQARSVTGSAGAAKGDILFQTDLSFLTAPEPVPVAPEKWGGQTAVTLYPGEAKSTTNKDGSMVPGHFFLLMKDAGVSSDDMEAVSKFGFFFLKQKQSMIFQRPSIKQTFEVMRRVQAEEMERKRQWLYLEQCLRLDYTPPPPFDDGTDNQISFRQLENWNDHLL